MSDSLPATRCRLQRNRSTRMLPRSRAGEPRGGRFRFGPFPHPRCHDAPIVVRSRHGGRLPREPVFTGRPRHAGADSVALLGERRRRVDPRRCRVGVPVQVLDFREVGPRVTEPRGATESQTSLWLSARTRSRLRIVYPGVNARNSTGPSGWRTVHHSAIIAIRFVLPVPDERRVAEPPEPGRRRVLELVARQPTPAGGRWAESLPTTSSSSGRPCPHIKEAVVGGEVEPESGRGSQPLQLPSRSPPHVGAAP